MTLTRPKCWFNVVKNNAGQWYWDFYDKYNVQWAVSAQVFSSKEAALKDVEEFREMTRGAVINAELDD